MATRSAALDDGPTTISPADDAEEERPTAAADDCDGNAAAPGGGGDETPPPPHPPRPRVSFMIDEGEGGGDSPSGGGADGDEMTPPLVPRPRVSFMVDDEDDSDVGGGGDDDDDDEKKMDVDESFSAEVSPDTTIIPLTAAAAGGDILGGRGERLPLLVGGRASVLSASSYESSEALGSPRGPAAPFATLASSAAPRAPSLAPAATDVAAADFPVEVGYGAVRYQFEHLREGDGVGEGGGHGEGDGSDVAGGGPAEMTNSLSSMSTTTRKKKVRARNNWGKLKDRVHRGSAMIRSFASHGSKDRGGGEGKRKECRHGGVEGECLICKEREEEDEEGGAGAKATPPRPPSLMRNISDFAKNVGRGGGRQPAKSSRQGTRRSLLQFRKKREDITDLPYDFTLWEITLALTVYLLVAMLAYSVVFEKWDIVDSMYFAVVTFTTVGYGDIVPTTDASRAFTAFFALTGIAFLSIGLGVIGSRMVESELKLLQAAEDDSTKAMSILLGRTEKHIEKDRAAKGHIRKIRKMMSRDEVEERGGLTESTRALVLKLVSNLWPALLSLFVAVFAMAWNEGWSVWTTLYFCVVTTTTIGYGDYAPTSFMKWVMILFIPLAVGIMGHIISAVADFIIERRREVHQKMLWCRDLTVRDLEAMDGDANGSVSELEYVEFMLVALKKVDSELLDELHSQFRELDVTSSGEITKQDLKILAKKRLQRVRNKLALSSYKYRLLHPEKSSSNDSRRTLESNSSRTDIV